MFTLVVTQAFCIQFGVAVAVTNVLLSVLDVASINMMLHVLYAEVSSGQRLVCFKAFSLIPRLSA